MSVAIGAPVWIHQPQLCPDRTTKVSEKSRVGDKTRDFSLGILRIRSRGFYRKLRYCNSARQHFGASVIVRVGWRHMNLLGDELEKLGL